MISSIFSCSAPAFDPLKLLGSRRHQLMKWLSTTSYFPIRLASLWGIKSMSTVPHCLMLASSAAVAQINKFEILARWTHAGIKCSFLPSLFLPHAVRRAARYCSRKVVRVRGKDCSGSNNLLARRTYDKQLIVASVQPADKENDE